jgi:hypothetical protein
MRKWIGIGAVVALAVAVAVGFAWHGSEAANASLTVACVPHAEVFVDNVSQGPSGRTLALSAGSHKVELRMDGFVAQEDTIDLASGEKATREYALAPKDPSDPVVIAKLAECEGVDVAPFVAPETTRGSRGKHAAAVLLWPARDVRKAGLVNYAIEADESYGGDATLEFRHGRKVLYRQSFKPETVTTVRAIPAEVVEDVKVGSSITWGLYYEDSRRPITAKFTVVKRPNAERQLERIRKSRYMQRQPEITREIMAATILENNRLYTEALVANLKIANAHRNSIQPFRGIVTTLRRLDADNSELFCFVSPHVSGKGGHAGIDRPGASARGGMELGLGAWSPVQAGAVPVAPAAEATPAARSGHAQGVTPPSHADSGNAPAAQAPTTPSTQAQPATTDATRSEVARLSRNARALADGLADQKAAADQAQQDAADAERTAQQAEAAAAAAEDAAKQAREAVENSNTAPTQAQQDEMAQAGVRAEEARETATQTRHEADRLRSVAGQLQDKATQTQAQLDATNAQIAHLSTKDASSDGKTSPATGSVAVPHQTLPSEKDAQAALANAQEVSRTADQALTDATAAYQAAQAAYNDDPSGENGQLLEAASKTLEVATKAATDAQQALDAARQVADQVAQQPKDGIK